MLEQTGGPLQVAGYCYNWLAYTRPEIKSVNRTSLNSLSCITSKLWNCCIRTLSRWCSSPFTGSHLRSQKPKSASSRRRCALLTDWLSLTCHWFSGRWLRFALLNNVLLVRMKQRRLIGLHQSGSQRRVQQTRCSWQWVEVQSISKFADV